MTYQQVLDFLMEGNQYVNSLDGENKLSYAIKKVSARLRPIVTKYNEVVDDLKIDLASTDEKGNLIMNGESYSFKPEKRKELNRKCKEFRQMECDAFEPYFATEIPEISEALKEILTGFVIK